MSTMERSDLSQLVAGSRIEVRDAEWRVVKVINDSTGGKIIECEGVDDLVRGQKSMFLENIEGLWHEKKNPYGIRVLDPAETKLVNDKSSRFVNTRLYLESQLRQTPPTDSGIYVGHKGAIDALPYQLDPAVLALKQPRQRILMADDVGLGKTIEVGILASELIKRGRGDRILVLCVKSMLTQFQKELWSRFSIPLVRLDSRGLQKVRREIPSNANPFDYYPKSIISIDTLKKESEYRSYIENSYWDIIIIDEAHNVAERGTSSKLSTRATSAGSQRARLAKLLSSRSDTLIMASATPHDGKAESFASLMNMLNPTAIADPSNYTKEDIGGLFLRAFKKDVANQVKRKFQQREVLEPKTQSTRIEDEIYKTLNDSNFAYVDRGRHSGQQLFKTGLKKSLLSSPMACLKTIETRITKLEKLLEEEQVKEEYLELCHTDIAELKHLQSLLIKVDAKEFSKYQLFLNVLDKHVDIRKGKVKNRLVLFSERIETLNWLMEQLTQDLKLKKDQIELFHGSAQMSDEEQNAILDRFNSPSDKIRILLSSDIASEGVNLHHQCHHLIHFDIPWSLMTFQQRNGRIDRYGQEKVPYIYYLQTESENPDFQREARHLEVLIRKDQQVHENIGDPMVFLREDQRQAPEKVVEKAFDEELDDLDAMFLEIEEAEDLDIVQDDTTRGFGEEEKRQTFSLFENEAEYFKSAQRVIEVSSKEENDIHYFPLTEDLKYRYKFMPKDTIPNSKDENPEFKLTEDRDLVQQEIERCRGEDKPWPEIQLLWPQHPIMEWVSDRVQQNFGRHEAPIVVLPELSSEENYFLIYGVIPNKKGIPVVAEWFVVNGNALESQAVKTFEEFTQEIGLQKLFPANQEHQVEGNFLGLKLPEVIDIAKSYMSQSRAARANELRPELKRLIQSLKQLKTKHETQLELNFTEGKDQHWQQMMKNTKDQKQRDLDKIFKGYENWLQESMQTEDNPYLKVMACFVGGAE